MFVVEHSTKEFLEALKRLNQRQNEKNLFVNITDKDVFREIARYRKAEEARKREI